MFRRCVALVLTAVLMLSLSGCSFMTLDVDSQLRSPHAVGEQSAIQTALEQHIYTQNAQGETAVPISYVLKYPKMGEYRSAFIMKDVDGNGTEDALAFYALKPEGANTHIVLLCKQQGVWYCADDIEGLATEIERLHFADLDGDGTIELVTGFSMYNTRDRRLMLYTWSTDHFVERYTDTYTNIIVAPIVKNGRDDLVLFRLNAEEKRSTVKLLSMQENTIVEQGTAALDGYITDFGPYTLDTLQDDVRGIYQDCVKDAQTTITELILWDGERLTAPLYDPAENLTTMSARESKLPCMDIDKDGETEWPQSFRLPGDETTPTEQVTVWLSDWYAWDQDVPTAVHKLCCLAVPEDGYYVGIPESWRGNITASYDKTKHRLVVSEVVNGVKGDTLFDIVTFAEKDGNPMGGEGYLFMASTDKRRYEIHYDRDSDRDLSMQWLSDLFELCEIH